MSWTMRIEKRHGREYLMDVQAMEVCGAKCDGFRCNLSKDHGGDEHIATGFWYFRAGAEICKRWPVDGAEESR